LGIKSDQKNNPLHLALYYLMIRTFWILVAGLFTLVALAVSAETNQPVATANSSGTSWPTKREGSFAQRAEQIRPQCLNGRRAICGKVIKILPEGLIVESGYTRLMKPPFNGGWVVPGTVQTIRDANQIEESVPGAVCIGIVLLTDFPNKPSVQLYDYVLLQGYPAGLYTYTPVPDVHKLIRRFAGGLDTAVKLTVEATTPHDSQTR
jgi:hypothetical protein